MLRQYQTIWEKIKQNGRCSVSAPKISHPRIVKAVTKEKYMDVVFKYSLGENCQKATLSHTSQGSKLTFFLSKSIGLSDY